MAAGIPLVPTAPADQYAWAVQQANREYPRIAPFDFRLTYNPKREGYSETFPPRGEEANPFPGHWAVEMGNSPLYRDPRSWPGIVALESLHALQAEDPRYQAMTTQLLRGLTPRQLEMGRRSYDQRLVNDPGDRRSYEQFMYQVFLPEMIRGRMFAPYFHRWENAPSSGWNEYQYTHPQQKLIDQIEQYMRSSG